MNKELFKKVHQPTLTLYYFKDDQHQDNVVKVSAIREMMSEISTPAALKKQVAIPNAGNHVLGSPIVSRDIITVEKETAAFMASLLQQQF
jgi:hypothetical protein